MKEPCASVIDLCFTVCLLTIRNKKINANKDSEFTQSRFMARLIVINSDLHLTAFKICENRSGGISQVKHNVTCFPENRTLMENIFCFIMEQIS